MFLNSLAPGWIPGTSLQIIDEPVQTSPLNPTISFLSPETKENPSPFLRMVEGWSSLTSIRILP